MLSFAGNFFNDEKNYFIFIPFSVYGCTESEVYQIEPEYQR